MGGIKRLAQNLLPQGPCGESRVLLKACSFSLATHLIQGLIIVYCVWKKMGGMINPLWSQLPSSLWIMWSWCPLGFTCHSSIFIYIFVKILFIRVCLALRVVWASWVSTLIWSNSLMGPCWARTAFSSSWRRYLMPSCTTYLTKLPWAAQHTDGPHKPARWTQTLLQFLTA